MLNRISSTEPTHHKYPVALNKVGGKLFQICPYLFFAMLCAFTLWMDSFIARNILDGDAAEYLLRGFVMAKQNTLIPKNYALTTELRVLDMPLIFSLLFRVLQSWTAVRVIGTVIAQALLVLSYIYVTRHTVKKPSVRLIGAGLLLLPVSAAYARMVLYHVHYTCYLAEALFLTGLLLRLSDSDRREWRTKLRWFFYLLLSFLCGLNGIRIAMIFFAPLGLTLVWRHAIEHRRDRKLSAFFSGSALSGLTVLLIGLLAFLPGLLISVKMLGPRYHVSGIELQPYNGRINITDWLQIAESYGYTFGTRNSNAALLSLRGISLGCALLIMLFVFCCSVYGTTKNGRWYHLLPLCGFLCTALSIYLAKMSSGCERLLMPMVVMTVYLIILELYERRTVLRACTAILMILCFCFQGLYTTRFLLSMGRDETEEWRGLAYTQTDTVENLRPAVDYLCRSGESIALSEYWISSVITEMSNGKVITSCYWYDESIGQLHYCGTWGTWREPFYAENRPDSLLLVVKTDELSQLYTYCPEAVLEFEHPCWSVVRAPAACIDFSDMPPKV